MILRAAAGGSGQAGRRPESRGLLSGYSGRRAVDYAAREEPAGRRNDDGDGYLCPVATQRCATAAPRRRRNSPRRSRPRTTPRPWPRHASASRPPEATDRLSRARREAEQRRPPVPAASRARRRDATNPRDCVEQDGQHGALRPVASPSRPHRHEMIDAPPGCRHLSTRSGGRLLRILKRVYFPIRPRCATKTSMRAPGLSRRSWKPRIGNWRALPDRLADLRTGNGPPWRYGHPLPRQRTVILAPTGAVTKKRCSRTPCLDTVPRMRTIGKGAINSGGATTEFCPVDGGTAGSGVD